MKTKKAAKSKKGSPKRAVSRASSSSVSNAPLAPLGDRVLIKELDQTETGRKTDTGIFIPDTVKEDRDSKRGTVVAVGAGKMEDGKRIALEVRVGDKVVFSWGDKITLNDESFYLVRESEISAIIK